MDPINIDIDLENRLPSMTILYQHMEEENEEEVHVPFTFVDVNVSQALLMLFTTLNSLTFF
jgi:hypothetical protein